MSFYVEFTAESVDDAKAILPEEHLPELVRAVILQALEGIPTGPVSVKATGHLWDGPNSWSHSNADLSVKPYIVPDPVKFRKPKVSDHLEQ